MMDDEHQAPARERDGDTAAMGDHEAGTHESPNREAPSHGTASHEAARRAATGAAEREASGSRRTGQRGRATRPRHPDRPCLNCGDATRGEYCPSCGQRKVDIQVSVRALVADVLEDQFLVDWRLPRTLAALVFRPGLLTVEHVNGRIVRYARPFKLYLGSSIIFFLLLSFVSLRALERAEFGDPRAMQGAEPASPAAVDPSPGPQDRTAPAGADTSPAAESPGMVLDSPRAAVDSPRAAVDSPVGPAPARDGDPERSWLENVSVKTGIAQVDSVVAQRLRRLGRLETRDAVQEVARSFMNYVPTVMFVLLPVFAGVLKLLYIRRRRYYAEHFIFLLHTHSFLFVVFTLLLLVRPWLSGGLVVPILGWVAVYILLAMKRVYGQGWIKTFAKYCTLGWMYIWILSFSIPVAFVLSILLLPG